MISVSRTKRVNDILVEDFEWPDEDEDEEGEGEILPQPSSLSVGIVLPDGTVEHRNEAGQLHRLDGPAFEGANGSRWWYQNGLLHRPMGRPERGWMGPRGGM